MLLPGIAERIEKPVVLVAKVLLPLAVVALLGGTWQTIWAAVGESTVIAMVVFIAGDSLSVISMGGPDPDHSVVLALSSACQHPGIALAIATANFPDQHFGSTILLYLILSAVVCTPYMTSQRRQVSGTMATA